MVSCGAITAKGDVAFGASRSALRRVVDSSRVLAGGNCEGIMRKQSDETGTTSTTVGASFMNWRGDVALGGNAQARAAHAGFAPRGRC